MRIVGDIEHPRLKITVFKNDGRFSLKFENGKYKIAEKSLALPLVVAEKLTEFIYESVNISRLEWIGKVKDWAKSVK